VQEQLGWLEQEEVLLVALVLLVCWGLQAHQVHQGFQCRQVLRILQGFSIKRFVSGLQFIVKA
jgi:hypothetical protein